MYSKTIAVLKKYCLTLFNPSKVLSTTQHQPTLNQETASGKALWHWLPPYFILQLYLDNFKSKLRHKLVYQWVYFITGLITEDSHEATTTPEYRAARQETDDSIADVRDSGDYFESLILGASADPYTKLLGGKQKISIMCSVKDSESL